MKVKELKEVLNLLEDNAEVSIIDDEQNYAWDIKECRMNDDTMDFVDLVADFSSKVTQLLNNSVQVTKIYQVSDEDYEFKPMGEHQFIEFAKGRIDDIDFAGINTWAEDEWVERLEHLADNKDEVTLADAEVICNALYFDVIVEEIY